MVKRARGLGHVTCFFKFWDPLISQERLKIDISNFACCLSVRDTKQKNCEIGEKGAWPGSHNLLLNFGNPPNTSGTAEDRNLKFDSEGRLMLGHTKQKM